MLPGMVTAELLSDALLPLSMLIAPIVIPALVPPLALMHPLMLPMLPPTHPASASEPAASAVRRIILVTLFLLLLMPLLRNSSTPCGQSPRTVKRPNRVELQTQSRVAPPRYPGIEAAPFGRQLRIRGS